MDGQKEEITLANMLLVVMLHFYWAGENQSSTMTLEFWTILLDLQHQFYIFILNFYLIVYIICTEHDCAHN
jgi:ABC-type branched-subunit amino acid transport system permease subunit